MKQIRLPLFIALGVAVLGIVLGSFFDLPISQAIASADNGFALTVSAIGPTIAFAAVAAMGGGFVAFIAKGQYHIALKVLFGVLAAACLGVAIYYPAGEYFGVNGFYGAAPEWIGYLIVIIPECAAMAGGYFLFRDFQNKNLWIVFCIVIAILVIALLGAVNGLKGLIHRPRFRLLVAEQGNPDIFFHNWWEPTKNYKDLIATYGIHKDNFKSYPSGHTAEASIVLVAFTFLPLAHKKFERWQLPLFLGGSALVLLVAFARILAAAHFLSDVSWGAAIQLILTIIANEVIIHIKALHPEEEAPAE